MPIDPRPRSGWKKELIALLCGLLLGSAWQVVHAALPPAVIAHDA